MYSEVNSTVFSVVFSILHSIVLGVVYRRQEWGGAFLKEKGMLASQFDVWVQFTVYSAVYSIVYGVVFSNVKACLVSMHSLVCN